MQSRLREDIFTVRGVAFNTYTVGWVVGILESNAKHNSKLRLKSKLKIELSLGIKLFIRSLLIRNN